VLALAIIAIAWFALARTATGLRLRAIGLSPEAARFAGIGVERLLLRTALVSGAIAGKAGASEVAGINYQLTDGISSGFGYTGIVVATLGAPARRRRPRRPLPGDLSSAPTQPASSRRALSPRTSQGRAAALRDRAFVRGGTGLREALRRARSSVLAPESARTRGPKNLAGGSARIGDGTRWYGPATSEASCSQQRRGWARPRPAGSSASEGRA
jgi:hypothetical protein